LGGSWTSQRGDEWWYSGSRVEARGEGNAVPPAFQIGQVTFRGVPTSAALHDLIWATAQRFPGEQVRLALSRELSPLLDELAQAGLVEWATVANPSSREARFTRIDPPVRQQARPR
jgi:hypothetical protein